MPYHASSSAAPVADTVADTSTNKSFSKKIKKKKGRGRPKRLRVTCFDDVPSQPLSEEEKKYIEESLVPIDPTDHDEFHDACVDPGPLQKINLFDAKGLIHNRPEHCGLLPVQVQDLKKDPVLSNMLTKSATLAIADYSSKTKTNYRFVNIEMAVLKIVNGVFHYITFQAKNAEKECETFEATVFTNRGTGMVKGIRMKRSKDWYVGTLSELID